MTEVTMTATEDISSMFIDISGGNISGTIQVMLDTPEPQPAPIVASTTTYMRVIADTSPEVQEAIETLKAAVLSWQEEDQEP